MDPFFASSPAQVRTQERSDLRNVEIQPHTTLRSSSPSLLRRSTGLFNLKLKSASNNSVSLENLPANELEDVHLGNITPDDSVMRLPQTPGDKKQLSSSSNPLKRPHPFNSTIPKSTSAGFLSFSNPSNNVLNKKRLHAKAKAAPDDTTLPDTSEISHAPQVVDLGTQAMTPEMSFKGAKPIQTAFTSTGLQSKRSISNSPKLQVPETPCKRHISDTSTIEPPPLPSWPIPPIPPPQNTYTQGKSTASSLKPQWLHRSSDKSGPGLSSKEDDSMHSIHSMRSINSLHSMQSMKSMKSMKSTHSVNSMNSMTSMTSMASMNANRSENLNHMPEYLEPPEVCTSPISRSARKHKSNSRSAPIDRMQRFSLSNIYVADTDSSNSSSFMESSQTDVDADLSLKVPNMGNGRNMTIDDDRIPDTPTRHTNVHTSTPLRKDFDIPPASYQNSEASTITPGTVARPLPSVLRHLDDSDSLSLSPPTAICGDLTELDSNSPKTPELDDSSISRFSNASDRHCGSTHASPVPRQHRRPNEKRPSLPQINIDTQTPSSKRHMDLSMSTTSSSYNSPHTPGRVTPVHHSDLNQFDELLAKRFGKVQSAAVGEFSVVFVVTQGKRQYAVKRTKRPMKSKQDSLHRREEIDILRSLSLSMELTSPDEFEIGSTVPHIVQFVDEWISNEFGYIMTEFCENGDLSRFLAAQGRVSRLEEWRVWKILLESLMGLSVIHNAGILHLDLKPANILVTFEGHLKIGDFGMATRYPVPSGFEREGDREYIAPEVLQLHEYGPPADIFSLGLMMVEVAANIVLPDNGEHWHRLRSGDLSDAGRLSSGDLTIADCLASPSCNEANPPKWAPFFLIDGTRALDRVVQHMLKPDPSQRPGADDLLGEAELTLVAGRRQAGAIVYEGEFGPKPDNEIEINAWQRA
ncbi:tyrosine protein kinase [Starmerella bacillaris]|uniref:Tyrosine protein kinase n=1 Tax=Starmerella bacillaris TaxID=1247836 RepID=A0AAV5RM17_STABA|nr:tyrosine protein kinase [Starmerella bacillaris]